jgi:hypothetical protein
MGKKRSLDAPDTVIEAPIEADAARRRRFSALSVNVRLDDELRRALREVMAANGFTISQAVRHVLQVGFARGSFTEDVTRAAIREGITIGLRHFSSSVASIVAPLREKLEDEIRQRQNG